MIEIIPTPARVRQNRWIKENEVPTQFKNRVVIDSTKTNLDEAVNWCDENKISKHRYDIVNFYGLPAGKYMRLFSFVKKEDAMAFKLTFT